jgi:hypothetical protein
MKIRKQVYELTPEDLSKFPVWEFALDEEGKEGQNKATVRPYELSGALDPSGGKFVVRASFTLADGSTMQGYLTPPVHGDDSLGTLQPIIVAAHRQVAFWCGVRSPSPDELARNYRSLGRDAGHVFPLRFASEVELLGGPVRGSLAGFMVLEDMNTKKIKTLT